MNYREFIQQLSAGTIRPVYLFTGEEPFLIDSAVRGLQEACLDPATRDFNDIAIDAASATAGEILGELQSLPVFSPRRFVLLKNAGELAAAEANRLAGYLEDPSPSTCFALTAAKIDGRRTFFQTLSRHHAVVECRPLPESELPGWIREQARALGQSLAEEAAAFLIEQVGSDLYRLKNEIVKAGLAAEGRKTVSLEDVRKVCGAGGQWFIPDLLQALGERRAKTAAGVLKNLLESGEVPLVILAAIARQFRQAFRIKQALLSGLPEAAVQKQLGIWRMSWPSLLKQAKAFRIEEAAWIFRRLVETDAGLKGGSWPIPVLMESLVLDLCAGEKKSLRRFLGRQKLVHLDRQA